MVSLIGPGDRLKTGGVAKLEAVVGAVVVVAVAQTESAFDVNNDPPHVAL